ncbi:MAG TPA: hypothetical protein VMU46_09575, partial [Burkholderiales bacterium]|nr:hypothetical protein [Burkholderiales bacterium]
MQQLGMIRPGGQSSERVAPYSQRGVQIGRTDLRRPRDLRGDPHVLRHQRELEAGGEGAGEDLLRDLALGGAVLPG